MNDRLAELKKAAPQAVDMDNEDRGVPPQSESMKQFYADVELVKKNIVVIKQAAKRIGDISQQVRPAYEHHVYPSHVVVRTTTRTVIVKFGTLCVRPFARNPPRLCSTFSLVLFSFDLYDFCPPTPSYVTSWCLKESSRLLSL